MIDRDAGLATSKKEFYRLYVDWTKSQPRQFAIANLSNFMQRFTKFFGMGRTSVRVRCPRGGSVTIRTLLYPTWQEMKAQAAKFLDCTLEELTEAAAVAES